MGRLKERFIPWDLTDPAELARDEAVKEYGTKFDTKKPMPQLLPADALTEISKVMAFGADKYAEENWRRGFTYKRIIGALLRHTYAFQQGEDNDPETGLSHMAHAGCCVLFLLHYILNVEGADDRYKPETQEKV